MFCNRSVDNEPLDWAMTQDNLGTALRMIAERETGTERLQASIAAYDQALKVRTQERTPLEWAQTTGGRGVAAPAPAGGSLFIS